MHTKVTAKHVGDPFYETQCISYFRVSGVGLPDLPGDAVFHTLSPASRGEAARKNKSPVFC